jgi:HSP20 family molecular chaperone IbpA
MRKRRKKEEVDEYGNLVTKPDSDSEDGAAIYSSPFKDKKTKTISTDDLNNAPKVTVWEGDDSFLVALEVPGLIRTSLQHKASTVVLEVQGLCRFPEIIENKWPATMSFGKEFRRTIEFSKAIDPSNSGLIDVPCEGVIFYKCQKQQIGSVSLTPATMKLS